MTRTTSKAIDEVSVSRSTAGQGLSNAGTVAGYPAAYEEALRIDQDAPGTVCLDLSHYQNRVLAKGHFHEQPYRVGFVHHYRMPNEHWHANEKSYRGCEQ